MCTDLILPDCIYLWTVWAGHLLNPGEHFCSHSRPRSHFSTENTFDSSYCELIYSNDFRLIIVNRYLMLQHHSVYKQSSNVLFTAMKLKNKIEKSQRYVDHYICNRDIKRVVLRPPYPVLHGLLDQAETLPAGVKLVFMRAFKVKKVTDYLQNKNTMH